MNVRERALRPGVLVCALACLLIFACLLTFGAGGLSGCAGKADGVAAGSASETSPSGASGDSSASASSSGLGEGGQSSQASESAGAQAAPESGPGVSYAAGEVLVMLEEDVTADDVNRYLRDADFIATKSVTEDDIAGGFVTLELADGVQVEEAVELLSQEGAIGSAQPNYLYRLQDDGVDVPSQALASLVASTGLLSLQEDDPSDSSATNDPLISQQWALDAMHVPAAWSKLLEKGALSDDPSKRNSVGVAVIDQGFNVDHEDLSDVVVDEYNVVEDKASVYELDVRTGTGHGTHVAGIAAAHTNNGKGIAGVSHNANLVLVQAFDSSGTTTSKNLAKAYEHVLSVANAYNVRVVNISVGGAVVPEKDDVLLSKIDKAYDQGIVTVCSAGNRTSTQSVPYYNYPSDYEKAVSVINVNRSLTRSSSSNYNDASANEGAGERNKNISAPGSSVYSTFWYKGAENDYYGNNSGTSMAAPQVTGVLALVFLANPDLSASEAVDILYSTATDLNKGKNLSPDSTFDYETGFGMANAEAAVEKALGEESTGQSEDKSDEGGSQEGGSQESARGEQGANGGGEGQEGGSSGLGDSSGGAADAGKDEPAATSSGSSAKPVKTPTWSGATRVPVGATARYSVKDGTVKVISGSANAKFSGNQLRGIRAGEVKLGLFDKAGKRRAVKTVSVYDLSGKWRIRSASNTKLMLDVRSASKKKGADLIAWTKNGKLSDGAHQQFCFVRSWGGAYVMRNVNSGKLIGVQEKAQAKVDNANVCQKTVRLTWATRWKLSVDAKNRVSIVSARTGKALAFDSSRVRKNTSIVQRAVSSSVKQKWILSRS